MSKYIGRRIDVGIARESTRGVGVAPSFWLPKTALTFFSRANVAKIESSAGNIVQALSAVVTDQWGEGSIEGEIRDKSFALLMYAAFGTLNSAASGGSRKHTLTLANTNQHQSLSIGRQTPDNDELFELAMINRLSIIAAPGELVRYEAEFQSKKALDSVFTPSYDGDENKFHAKHVSIKIANNSSELDAASALSIKAFRINIDKNLIRDNILGSLQPEDIMNRQFNITGEITFNYESTTYRDFLMLNKIRQRALRMDIVNTDVTIGTTNPAIRIDLPKVNFDSWELTGENDELVTQTIVFQAYLDLNNNVIISDAYVVNETTSY